MDNFFKDFEGRVSTLSAMNNFGKIGHTLAWMTSHNQIYQISDKNK